jgi:D-serine deaminase-like pyridoxal phosphate-dependent protein
VYVFGDLFQASIGSCAVDDIALTVLSTVISSRGGGRAVIDAGGLALSKDRSTAATEDAGYGRVCDLHGRPLGEAVVVDVHQEHGEVRGLPEDLPVGTRVRVLPNHACMTAAAHPGYHVVDGGLDVLARWSRINGW